MYDPNNVVNNLFNASDVAVPVSPSLTTLAPLTGYELEGTSLYLNGYPSSLAVASSVPPSMTGYLSGSSYLSFKSFVEFQLNNRSRSAVR